MSTYLYRNCFWLTDDELFMLGPCRLLIVIQIIWQNTTPPKSSYRSFDKTHHLQNRHSDHSTKHTTSNIVIQIRNLEVFSSSVLCDITWGKKSPWTQSLGQSIPVTCRVNEAAPYCTSSDCIRSVSSDSTGAGSVYGMRKMANSSKFVLLGFTEGLQSTH